jgi:hypothetical protein
MATYITLGNFTDQGIRSVKDTTKRADALKERAKSLGVTATYADVKNALTSKIDLNNSLEAIAKSAADLQQTFRAFRARQIEGGGSVPAEDKLALRQRLKKLDEELNRHLAAGYGVSTTNAAA